VAIRLKSFNRPKAFSMRRRSLERRLLKVNGSVAAVGNDWLGSAILQPQTHLGAVGGLVADHAFRCFACGDEPLRDRAVMRFAAGQEDGEKTAPSICACMDLRIAPAS
jgi:hypothetical protein